MNNAAPGSVVTLPKAPNRGFGIVLGYVGDNVQILFEDKRQQVKNRPEYVAAVPADEVPDGTWAHAFVQREREVLTGIAEWIHADIRRLWYSHVLGGDAGWKKTEDRGGSVGQHEISELLLRAGVARGEARWKTVIKHGQTLYKRDVS